MAAHAAPCQAVGVSFIPLVVETLSGWSERAADTLTSIGRLLGHPPAIDGICLYQFLLPIHILLFLSIYVCLLS